MKTLSDVPDIFIIMGAIVVFFVVSKVLECISFHTEETISIAIKIITGIGILSLIYFVYPNGITDTPISSVTVGELGRILIVAIAGAALLVDLYLIFLQIREELF